MRFTFDGWQSHAGKNLSRDGVGFRYKYIKRKNILRISGRHDRRLYHDLAIRTECSEEPLLLTHHIEKLSQIKALSLSGNRSVNLLSTVQPSRIEPILENLIQLARYSFWLEQHRFHCFSCCIIESFALNKFNIDTIDKGHNTSDRLYNAHIETISGHSARASAFSLVEAISNISHKAIHDLVVREYNLGKNQDAEQLMKLSIQLNYISKILDNSFEPKRRIIPQNPFRRLFNTRNQH